MSRSEPTIGVCLHELAAREAAVVRRVMAFSASQGRHYQECGLSQASLLVVSDDRPVPLDALNPQGCMIVRIADRESVEPWDVMLERPLLVTRVLRSLDEARALLQQLVPAPPETPSPPLPPAGLFPVPAFAGAETPPLLPSRLPGAPEPAAEPAAASLPAGARLALAVDDSAAIRKQLELELQQAGIEAEFAEDGEQALALATAGRHDLIFLDIVMPGLDGYEVCRRLRRREGLKKVPIIMLSARTSPLDEVQGVLAGATTYLTKPVRSEQLQKTLQRVSMWLDNFKRAR